MKFCFLDYSISSRLFKNKLLNVNGKLLECRLSSRFIKYNIWEVFRFNSLIIIANSVLLKSIIINIIDSKIII